jgi:hypothetical protein
MLERRNAMEFIILFAALIYCLKLWDRITDPHGVSDFSVQLLRGIEEKKRKG